MNKSYILYHTHDKCGNDIHLEQMNTTDMRVKQITSMISVVWKILSFRAFKVIGFYLRYLDNTRTLLSSQT